MFCFNYPPTRNQMPFMNCKDIFIHFFWIILKSLIKKYKKPPKKFKNAPAFFPLKKYKNPPKKSPYKILNDDLMLFEMILYFI